MVGLWEESACVSLSISMPEQSQFCPRHIWRASPADTTRQHPRKGALAIHPGSWVLGQAQSRQHFVVNPANPGSSHPFAQLFHCLTEQLIPKMTNPPQPVPLRTSNKTFLLDRGKEPEGTCDRRLERSSTAGSQARIQQSPAARAAPTPPALCQKATEPAAEGPGGPGPAGGQDRTVRRWDRATLKYPPRSATSDNRGAGTSPKRGRRPPVLAGQRSRVRAGGSAGRSGAGSGPGRRAGGSRRPPGPAPVATATLSATLRPRPPPRLDQWRGGARPARR